MDFDLSKLSVEDMLYLNSINVIVTTTNINVLREIDEINYKLFFTLQKIDQSHGGLFKLLLTCAGL